MTIYYVIAKKKTHGYPIGAIFKIFYQANGIAYAQKQNFAVDKETLKTRCVGVGQLYTYTVDSVRRIFTKPVTTLEDAIEKSILISEFGF